jgi:hypothetical protein
MAIPDCRIENAVGAQHIRHGDAGKADEGSTPIPTARAPVRTSPCALLPADDRSYDRSWTFPIALRLSARERLHHIKLGIGTDAPRQRRVDAIARHRRKCRHACAARRDRRTCGCTASRFAKASPTVVPAAASGPSGTILRRWLVKWISAIFHPRVFKISANFGLFSRQAPSRSPRARLAPSIRPDRRLAPCRGVPRRPCRRAPRRLCGRDRRR